MNSSKLLSFLVVAGVILFNAAIVVAQPAAKGQRGQKGGGIARLLQQAGATREQIEEFNDARSELRNAPNFRAALQAKLKSILTEQQYTKFEEVWRNRGQSQSKSASVPAPEGANKWKTAGLQQANTMGGGEAAISKDGKFRVFVLMGQSNMHGVARAAELEAPYNEKHDRIRIWANGRWEYFVARNRFGPGVSMAHQLAEFWPDDTIGIIKVASGGTGIRAFEKKWSFERANRTFDGKKGSLYQDLMNAVAEAKRISEPEFSGFVWKQGGADATRKDLAHEYFDTFKQLVSDLRADLGAPDLPVIVASRMNEKELLEVVLSNMNDEEVVEAKKSANKPPENDNELLRVLVSHLENNPSPEVRKRLTRRPHYLTVVLAQIRAGGEIPNATTINHGRLPVLDDGIHFNAEGQIKLGKMIASAVETFYQEKP